LLNAKGLLLLVNDGNYILEHNYVLYAFGRLLKTTYTSIDKLVYFTVNVKSMASDDSNITVWIPARSREEVNEIHDDFLESLRKGWMSFVERETGEKIRQYEIESDEDVDDIRLIR